MFQCVSINSFLVRIKSSVSIVASNRSDSSIIASRDSSLKCWYGLATTVSSIVFLLFFGLVYWLYTSSGGSQIDPLSENYSIASFSVILGCLVCQDIFTTVSYFMLARLIKNLFTDELTYLKHKTLKTFGAVMIGSLTQTVYFSVAGSTIIWWSTHQD